MAASDRILVVTSIPPTMRRLSGEQDVSDRYQRLCLQSWIECGFRVLSLNNSDEIDQLRERYPEVTFVPAWRNASAISGRKSPFIADLFQVLLKTSEPYLGIVNADIVFEPRPIWQAELPRLLGPALVTAQRYDTTSLFEGALRRFYPGFDCFFFDRALAEEVADHAGLFAMGLPWWDMWLPIAALLRDRKVRILERPAIVHLVHGQGYETSMLRRYGIAFADFVARDMAERKSPPAENLSSLLPACRDLAALPHRPDIPREQDQEIVERFSSEMTLWRNRLLENSFRLMPEGVAHRSISQTELSPAAVFHHVDERVSAGVSLETAKQLGATGQADEARRLFLDALDKTPNDLDVLIGVGEHLCQSGQAGEALPLLRRASQQQPSSPAFWNSFGFALRATSNRGEAITCFERALAIASEFHEAYYNLAVTLHEMKRTDDALRCLQAALERWPQDADFGKLHQHFSREAVLANVIRPNRR